VCCSEVREIGIYFYSFLPFPCYAYTQHDHQQAARDGGSAQEHGGTFLLFPSHLLPSTHSLSCPPSLLPSLISTRKRPPAPCLRAGARAQGRARRNQPGKQRRPNPQRLTLLPPSIPPSLPSFLTGARKREPTQSLRARTRTQSRARRNQPRQQGGQGARTQIKITTTRG